MKNTLIFANFLIYVITLIPLGLLSTPANDGVEEESKINVVVIDPGHGGKDEGAIYKNIHEKDIVLDIALKLGSYISTRFPETKVIYTRTTDEFVPLNQRANIANKNKADLFISIHVNFVGNPGVQGTETFVLGIEENRGKANLEVAKKENSVILLEDNYSARYEGFDPNSPESYIMFELVQDEYLDQSVLFASAIQNEFKNSAKRIDRSVKQAGFLVLWQTTMPSVLVEAGFLSNTAERNYLTSEAGRVDIATSIFNAFKDYKDKIERQNSFNLVSKEPNLNNEDVLEKIELNSVKQQIDHTVKTDTYFTVQVAALKNQIDVKSDNFQGELNIFKLNSGNLYRYCSGKFAEYEKAVEEKQRLLAKFEGAFVVAIENGKLISLKKAMKKM